VLRVWGLGFRVEGFRGFEGFEILVLKVLGLGLRVHPLDGQTGGPFRLQPRRIPHLHIGFRGFGTGFMYRV